MTAPKDPRITEWFPSIEAALEKYPDAYVAIEQWGDCKVCGNRSDLRCGACFDCSEHVDGEPVEGGHKLWDARNPDVVWFVKTS